MKNKIYLGVFLMILLIGIVSAADWPLCIDLIKPSAPTGLQATSNLQLGWNTVTDKPDCSGINYYNIYKDNVLIGTSKTTSYSGVALADGTYSLAVSAVDKAKNEGAKATIQVTFPLSSGTPTTPPSTGGSSGGGGGGSSGGGSSGSSASTASSNSGTCVENWQCGNWNNEDKQCGTRTCIDSNKCGTAGLKPVISKECPSTGLFSITGGAIGSFAKSGAGIATFSGLIAFTAVMVVMFSVRRKKKPTK